MAYKKLYTTPEYTPIDISTDAEMSAVLIDANLGKVYRFTGTTGTYTNGNLYEVEQGPNYSLVGGRIFYVHSDNGATYKFYDSSMNELTTQTVAGLENAYYYEIVSGTPTADKFYVYNNELTAYKQWGKFGTALGVTANTIGSGKPNSATCLAATDWESNSIWAYINTIRTNQVGGCNDWYIGSKAEQNKLRTSGLVNWYSNNAIWSSVETDENFGTLWIYFASDWDFNTKDSVCAACFGVRSF